ncbi:MAG: hypothetical protein [Bacteriophage sp.]|nr:MAG: hypothetical protein [Bacteriophage sp.]
MTDNTNKLQVLDDNALAEQALKLKNFKDKIEFDLLAPVNNELKAIEKILLDRFRKSDVKIKEYSGVRIRRSENTAYQLSKEHEDLFYKWLLGTYTGEDATKMFSFFTNKVSQTAVKEFVKETESTPPGLKLVSIDKLTISPKTKE